MREPDDTPWWAILTLPIDILILYLLWHFLPAILVPVLWGIGIAVGLWIGFWLLSRLFAVEP